MGNSATEFRLKDIARILSKITGPKQLVAHRNRCAERGQNDALMPHINFDDAGPKVFTPSADGCSWEKVVGLPHLHETHRDYRHQLRYKSDGLKRYKRRVDSMIQKHGPNKVVSFDIEADVDKQWSFVEGQKGGSKCETTKGGRKGPSVTGNGGTPTNASLDDLLTRIGRSVKAGRSRPTGNKRSSDQRTGQLANGVPFHSSSRKTKGRGPVTGGECQPRTSNGQTSSALAESREGKAGGASLQHMAARAEGKGNKQGVGVPATTKSRDGVRPLNSPRSGLENKTLYGRSTGDVVSPGSYSPPTPDALGKGYGGTPLGDYASDGNWLWGGSYPSYGNVSAYRGSSFFNPHSFKGGVGASFRSLLGLGGGRGRMTSTVEWNSEGAAISVTDKWREADPGGMVNAIEAKLKSKTLRKHAASIQRSMEECLVAMDIGAGLDPSPRKSGRKLIKELVGNSYRLSRCQREEMQTGLKLILVDISPSCSEIRDACYAAALSIADADKDAVVVCHFNGRSHTHNVQSSNGMDMACMIVGKRQAEIPELGPSLDSEIEKWAANANISGVIAFGDGDAASLYSLLSKHMPLVWLFPEGKEWAKELLARYQPKEVLDKNARLWIVSNVTNAQTCVQGLRRITKGGR